MLNFKRKRVLNPILMLKSIILSVFIGAFTVAASLSVDAAQISLEEELAILTGQDNHSKYLPVYRDVGTNTDVDQKTVTAALDVYNAYKDATAAAEEQKAFMDEGFGEICRRPDLYDNQYYKAVTSIINARAHARCPDMKQYDSEDEKTVSSAVYDTSVQNKMFNLINEAYNLFLSNGGNPSSTHICLYLPVGRGITDVYIESAENGHSEQSSLNDSGDCPHFGNNFSNQNTYTFDEEKLQDNSFGNNFSNQNTYTFDEEKLQDNSFGNNFSNQNTYTFDSEESQTNNFNDITDGWQYEHL